MAVYKPKRKGEASKYYICEFVYQGKRFQESTGATSKTVAKEYEKRRKAEMERAAAGMPTQQRAARIGTVNDVVGPYLSAYKVSHRPKSILFAEGRLGTAERDQGFLSPARSQAHLRHASCREWGFGVHHACAD